MIEFIWYWIDSLILNFRYSEIVHTVIMWEKDVFDKKNQIEFQVKISYAFYFLNHNLSIQWIIHFCIHSFMAIE